MRPYLGPHNVFHHAPPKYGIQNVKMQKRCFLFVGVWVGVCGGCVCVCVCVMSSLLYSTVLAIPANCAPPHWGCQCFESRKSRTPLAIWFENVDFWCTCGFFSLEIQVQTKIFVEKNLEIQGSSSSKTSGIPTSSMRGKGIFFWNISLHLGSMYINGWQLAKMKKSILDMSLSWNL